MSIAEFLLGQGRAAVLGALLLNPQSSLHVRELARLTGVSPGSLHRELRALADIGLLHRQEIGRQVHYRANTDNPIYEDLAAFLRKTSGLAYVLRDALAPLADGIRMALICSSMARGDAHAHSDVDLMVVGDLGFADVVVALQPAQDVLRREINPTVLSPADFAKKLKQRDAFVTQVWNGEKLWVIQEKSLSLENLVKIHQLQRHQTDAQEIQRLLVASSRNLADSQVASISDETRFDAAYKAIMQCAMLGLLAHGYRPSTTMPGHHQTMIQTLGLTLGVEKEVWIVLDALRKKRNLSDYSGDLVEPAAVAACIEQAQTLLQLTQRWLALNRPDLMTP